MIDKTFKIVSSYDYQPIDSFEEISYKLKKMGIIDFVEEEFPPDGQKVCL